MARKRNGRNDPRTAERRRSAYGRGATQPLVIDTFDQSPAAVMKREDDQLKCLCGLPRWEHDMIQLSHPFQQDPVDWASSRAYAESVGNAGLEDFYRL